MINNKFIFIVHYIKLITLIIFLSVLSFEFTFAQTDAKFERITRSDGLSHDNVYSIIQDKYGFIWFATQDGLNRYDGYGIRIGLWCGKLAEPCGFSIGSILQIHSGHRDKNDEYGNDMGWHHYRSQ